MITLLLILSYLAVFIFGAVCYAQFHAKAVATLQKGKTDADFLYANLRAEYHGLIDRLDAKGAPPPSQSLPKPPAIPDPPFPKP